MDFRIPYRVCNRVSVPAWGTFSLGGEIGRRFDSFIKKSITSPHGQEVLEEAVQCFRDQEDDKFHYGLWRGEFIGKLLLSETRVYRMTGNKDLGNMLRDTVYELLDCQREDGYIGTYKDSRSVFPADVSITVKECGWECNYNWNVWCRKYTLWGLIESALALDDPHILSCADRMGEQLVNELADLHARVKDTGVMSGMPSCSVMKPILLLYRLTGKKLYLDFALSVEKEWDREDNECPNLIRNGLASSAPLHWYESDRGEEWISKAYEMMSCFDGLCELYRVTGEERILAACEGFYRGLVRYESNILGSVSYCERFADAALHPDAATELCDIIHWMRLCHELFSITGKACYMESFERAFLNAYLAGVYDDGLTCAFFIRSHGRHWDAEMQCKTKYQHCCLNNLPRGFVNAAQSCVMQGEGKIYVNFYIPAKASFGGTSVSVGDGYLTNGAVTVTVTSEKEETLALRIPEWSAVTSVNGVNTVKAGEYVTITLPAGENTVRLQFDMTVRVLDFAYPVDALPDNDYHVRRYCGTKNTQSEFDRSLMLTRPMSTLRRGPLILARSAKLGATEEEMFSCETVCGKNASASVENVRGGDGYLFRGTVTLQGDGIAETCKMCDYASCANTPGAGKRTFTLFV